MKKIISIMLVALVAMTCVFASFGEGFSIGVGVGSSAVVEQGVKFKSFEAVRNVDFNFAATVRLDYDLEGKINSKDFYGTAVVGFYTKTDEMVTRKTNPVAFYREVKKATTFRETVRRSYITLLMGLTKAFDKQAFVVYTTVGPEVYFNLSSGKASVAAAGLVKLSYALGEHWTLDANFKGGLKLIEEGSFKPWQGDWSEGDFFSAFTTNQITLGTTYKF